VKLRGWHLGAGFLGGAVMAIASQWVLGAFAERYAPFDSYVVQSVVKDTRSNAYAALGSYHHGNSSSVLPAIWLGTGDAPALGETPSLAGQLGLVASTPIMPEQVSFGLDSSLIVTVPRARDISRDTSHCFFDDIEDDTYCLDAAGVILRVVP
jgi:hypothetical protein